MIHIHTLAINSINHHPKIIGPEYQQPYHHNSHLIHQQQQQQQIQHHVPIQQVIQQPPATIVKPTINLVQPTSAQATTMVVPQSSPSLMKIATERMKRKFLGWS